MEDQYLDASYEDRTHIEDYVDHGPEVELHEDDHRGWPGDGSGEDDLADYNQAEADDYTNE